VLTSALIAIIAQRLARLNCPACAEPDFPQPIYLKHLSIHEDQLSALRQSKGCAVCGFTGTRGRIGLYELMEVTSPLQSAILNKSEIDIRNAARQAGLISLTSQAVAMVLSGGLSVHEAYRVCNFEGRQ
jgi:type II secretory ATPase GspE/PulE/Tfp pilus assembly ATPase PilB-like protein